MSSSDLLLFEFKVLLLLLLSVIDSGLDLLLLSFSISDLSLFEIEVVVLFVSRLDWLLLSSFSISDWSLIEIELSFPSEFKLLLLLI